MLRIRSIRAAGVAASVADPDLARLAGELPARAELWCVKDRRRDAEGRLREAVDGLRRRAPELAASTGLLPWQRRTIAGLSAAGIAGAIAAPQLALMVLLALLAVPFLMVAALRTLALWDLMSREAGPTEGMEMLGDDELPSYSVLVPLFREAGVVPHLLQALRGIDYPRDKLDVLLLVESIDVETQAALAETKLDAHMRVIVVPDGAPRTKPRALQYALQLTRGMNVVVFDAEDVPEPDQLRRAAAALAAGAGRLGCLQGRLNIYNPDASWFTRQFAIEYTALFDCILPLLQRLRLPVPLGGTSNHFPRAVLDAVGGWDPFNVTEDADLGIRLARCGYEVGVLASTTWEEAPATASVWSGQRRRWLKGWMRLSNSKHNILIYMYKI